MTSPRLGGMATLIIAWGAFDSALLDFGLIFHSRAQPRDFGTGGSSIGAPCGVRR